MTGRKQSTATERALARVAIGEKPYTAALNEGISPSTIYRALARNRPRWDDERRADEAYMEQSDAALSGKGRKR